MTDSASGVPDGGPVLSPAIGVQDAERAMRWYARAVRAEEVLRLTTPGGSIVHAEMRIGDSLLMPGEGAPKFGNLAPASLGGTAVRLHLRGGCGRGLRAR